MSHDHNRWIITSRRYFEHKTIDGALKELTRIQAADPHKTYRMIRIKRTAHDSACAIYKDGPNGGPPVCNCPMGQYEAQIEAVRQEMAA